jgi:hypothetical protein
MFLLIRFSNGSHKNIKNGNEGRLEHFSDQVNTVSSLGKRVGDPQDGCKQPATSNDFLLARLVLVSRHIFWLFYSHDNDLVACSSYLEI